MDLMTYVLSKRKEPVLETLNVTENGGYTPDSNIDGWNQVEVWVDNSSSLGSLDVSLTHISESDRDMSGSIILSDTYNAENVGLDGWNEVIVPRIPPEPTFGSIDITQNGSYDATNYVDEYSSVQLDGFDYVSVNVPIPDPPVLTSLYITNNNVSYYAGQGDFSNIDGWNGITVDITEKPPEYISIVMATSSLSNKLLSFGATPIGPYTNATRDLINSNGLVNTMGQANVAGQLQSNRMSGYIQLTFQGMGTQIVPVNAVLEQDGSTSTLNIGGGGYDSSNDMGVYYAGIIDDTDILQFTKLVIVQNGTVQDLTAMASQLISNLSLTLNIHVNYLGNQ